MNQTVTGRPAEPTGRPPNVKDVAQRAGVSWKTVSNVVNGRSNVRPATRERVKTAIRELGYRTSLAGRQLRQGRTRLLAVALPELTTPYFANLAHEIIASAEEYDYTVLITETNRNSDTERHAASGFATQFADGIILSPVSLDSAGVLEAHGPTPLVLLGERVSGSHLDHVTIANEASGREAAEHLLAAGRRSLIFIGAHEGRQFGTGWLRALGFRSALEDAGIPHSSSSLVSVEQYDRASGHRAVQELLQAGNTFDGLVCASDLIALGAMHALRRNSLAVPADVAVLGWDGTPEGLYANPSLTTIALDAHRIAREAVALLIRRIEYPDAPLTEVVVEHTFTARESTTGLLT